MNIKTVKTIILLLIAFQALGQEHLLNPKPNTLLNWDGSKLTIGNQVVDTTTKSWGIVKGPYVYYKKIDKDNRIESKLINKPGARLYHSIDSSGLPTISIIWGVYESILIHKDSLKAKQEFKKYSSLDAVSALKRATKGYLYEGENAFVGRVVEISFDAIMIYDGKQIPCRVWIEDATIYYSIDKINWDVAPKNSEFIFTAKVL